MSDKELLELAAKAVGMHVKAHRVDADDKFTHLVVGQKFKPEKIDWNPLEDDGAALRLAVKLRIDLKFYDGHVVAWFDGGLIGTGRIYYGDDPAAASRRAIVRAAAEIGKSMQP
jgi:hypothetical protein